MANPPILFQNEANAKRLIAGLPCAVRAALNLARSGVIDPSDPLVFLAKGGWQSCAGLEREIARVVPGARAEFLAYDGTVHDGAICDGFRAAAPSGRISATSRAILAATGKETDGLVSRHINRPISQFLSLHLLKLSWIRPIHATIAAGLIGVIMALCLFLGEDKGLIAGAILFQIASIIDGVDGEIARATFRSSKLGATLDTAGDALTNFAFIAGVSANLWQAGHPYAGQAGAAGLALLFIGLSVLGALSLRGGGPLSFDALKHDAREASNPVMIALSKIASRDVYALALAVLIVIGLAPPAMMIFAGAIGIWFVLAMAMLIRRFVSA